MKKLKKLSAMLMASIITAGTVSSMSAGARLHFNDKKEMDKLIEDAFMIPYDNDWSTNNWYAGMYLTETEYDNCYDFIADSNIRSDYISAWVDVDIDVDNLAKAISEICPDAEHIVITMPCGINGDGFRGIGVGGFNGYLPYAEARKKDLTDEQIRQVYDLLNNTGKLQKFEVSKRTVNSIQTRSNLTVYLNEYNGINYKELIENYITENNLPCHTKKGGYSSDGFFQVIPDERISIAEHYDLADQIYKELNISPTLVFPETANITEDIVIDMHNNIKGDANDDGQLALSDAVAILQSIGNPDEYQLTPQGEFNADVTGDYDGITNKDALTIQRRLLGLE